jgi:hypothetical protein
MESEEKYKEVIEKLRNIKPQLSRSEGLTNSIVGKINKSGESRAIKVIWMVRPWLAVASIFLIGLFVYQQTETPEALPSKELVFSEKTPQVKACFDSLAFETNHKDRLLKTYLCYLQQEELKKKNSELMMQKLLNKL